MDYILPAIHIMDVLYFSVGSEGCLDKNNLFEPIRTNQFTKDIRNKLIFSNEQKDCYLNSRLYKSNNYKKIQITKEVKCVEDNIFTLEGILIIDINECRDKIINEFAIYTYNTNVDGKLNLIARFNSPSEIMSDKKKYQIPISVPFRLHSI